jgi:hypothetical protein
VQQRRSDICPSSRARSGSAVRMAVVDARGHPIAIQFDLQKLFVGGDANDFHLIIRPLLNVVRCPLEAPNSRDIELL